MAYKESHAAFQQRFCKNLAEALQNAGLSQRKQMLAGLDPRYIARLKRGESNPTLRTVWRICTVIGVDPLSLFQPTKKKGAKRKAT